MRNQRKIRYLRGSIPELTVLSCHGDFHFERHLHDGYVLWLNREGAEHFSLKGATHLLQPGSVSVIEPGEVHANHPFDPEKRHLCSFYFPHDFITKLKKDLELPNWDQTSLGTKVFENAQIWQELAALHWQMFANQEKLELENNLLSIFNSLLKSQGSYSQPQHLGQDCSKRLNRITEYLRENLSQKTSLESLAKLTGCTSFHLIRLFKEQKGMTPHAYLVQMRLERAKYLLDQGVGIAEAAIDTGFSDQSHLTRNFKKRYGVTPAVYVQQK